VFCALGFSFLILLPGYMFKEVWWRLNS
jgi:hypothetical protein